MKSISSGKALTRCTELGIAFHWNGNTLTCSTPPGTDVSTLMSEAEIDANDLSRALAERFERQRTVGSVVAAGAVMPSQERYLLSPAVLTETERCLVPAFIRIRGSLDPDRLQRALHQTVRNNAALRTQIRLRADGVLLQVVMRPSEESLPIVDLSKESNPDLALRAHILDWSSKPIPLHTTSSILRKSMI